MMTLQHLTLCGIIMKGYSRAKKPCLANVEEFIWWFRKYFYEGPPKNSQLLFKCANFLFKCENQI